MKTMCIRKTSRCIVSNALSAFNRNRSLYGSFFYWQNVLIPIEPAERVKKSGGLLNSDGLKLLVAISQNVMGLSITKHYFPH